MLPASFLLGMQAAGLITSVVASRNSSKLIQMGRQLEYEQFKTNLEAVRLQTAQDSLVAMKDLRKNIGSQIAANAAMGRRGSSYFGIQESASNFEADERTRRLNMLAKEAQLRSGDVTSQFNSLTSQGKLGLQLFDQISKTVPGSSLDDIFNWGTSTKTPATGVA
jgi:hypothetical protein